MADTGDTETGAWAVTNTWDTSTWLARLRQEFPRWGIIRPSPRGLWLAVSGKDITIRAPTADELRAKLHDAGGGRRPAS